jgi:hypothetical protein
MSEVQTTGGTFSRGWWLRVAAGGLIGGLVGYTVAAYLPREGGDLALSPIIATIVALVYLLIGLMVLVMTVAPRIGLAMKVFDDLDEWEEERALLLQSGLGCVFCGLLVFALLAVQPFGLISPVAGFALALLLLALSAWPTWRSWQLMDELWRKVTSEATVVAFYMVFVPGVVWSAAAHLRLIAPLAPIDWISLFLIASLAASIVATARRGMIESD